MMRKKKIKFFFAIIIIIILIYNPFSARLMTLLTASFYELDPHIFYRQIKAESSFKSLAYSRKGAIGLGQVMPETAGYINSKQSYFFLWFPPTNLMISAKYTKYLLKKYKKNWSLTLASYNWGETNVDKRISNMKISQNSDYKKIFFDIPETYAFIEKILEDSE